MPPAAVDKPPPDAVERPPPEAVNTPPPDAVDTPPPEAVDAPPLIAARKAAGSAEANYRDEGYSSPRSFNICSTWWGFCFTAIAQ